MESEEFIFYRKILKRTQKDIADLLGTSLKAIHSYEQGWRNIPTHVERQLYFLLGNLRESYESRKQCWTIKKCPPERKKECPAWEFQAGKFCWFINGTICECKTQDSWKEKMKICKKCEVFQALLNDLEEIKDSK